MITLCDICDPRTKNVKGLAVFYSVKHIFQISTLVSSLYIKFFDLNKVIFNEYSEFISRNPRVDQSLLKTGNFRSELQQYKLFAGFYRISSKFITTFTELRKSAPFTTLDGKSQKAQFATLC